MGYGKEALTYLDRYLYRGALPEKNILSDSDGMVTFRIKDLEGTEVIQTRPGGEFLWLLLRKCAAPPFPAGEGLRATAWLCPTEPL